MTSLDLIAVAWFILLWAGLTYSTDSRHRIGRSSLTQVMNGHRRAWFRHAARRELRMIDTSIVAGLQNGTAFFASTTILAIGGCFALLGSTDRVLDVAGDLPIGIATLRTTLELKVFGLTAVFAYAFFKFGWSYRLFNYCSILFGAMPVAADMTERQEELEAAADRAAEMNILAGAHFNSGLRAIFMAIGYMGWFAGPLAFMGASLLVVLVLARRQFFSRARQAALHGSPS